MIKQVRECKMGDATGNEDNIGFVFVTDARVTEYGTVKATVAHDRNRVNPDEPVCEEREWLYPTATLSIRRSA